MAFGSPRATVKAKRDVREGRGGCAPSRGEAFHSRLCCVVLIFHESFSPFFIFYNCTDRYSFRETEMRAKTHNSGCALLLS